MPADVHSGVAAVTLPLQGGARAAEFILRLQLNPTVLWQLWEPLESCWLANIAIYAISEDSKLTKM